MVRKFCLVVLALLVSVVGCSRARYQIRMTPTDEGFERELVCWEENAGEPREPRPLDSTQLLKIEDYYADPPEADEQGRATFRGQFETATPKDVGGAGRLERIETSLGTAWTYVERFRGDDDLEGELTARRVAADQLADLTLGWLEVEFGEEPKYPRLKRFVDEDLRKDLKNLAVYCWSLQSDGITEDTPQGSLERLWLYLHERDYLSLADTAAFYRTTQTQDGTGALEAVARWVARELEIEPGNERLAIFRDQERLIESLDTFIETTEIYAERKRMHASRDVELNAAASTGAERQPDKDEYPGTTVIVELLLEAFLGIDMGLSDSDLDMVEVTLDVPGEPVSTDGQWDEATKTVSWEFDLGSHPMMPSVCSATWVEPNAAEQKQRFGRVLLDREQLLEYALWCESLSEAESAQWQAALESCQASADWAETVQGFQFDEETSAKELLADVVKQLLLPAEEDGGEP